MAERINLSVLQAVHKYGTDAPGPWLLRQCIAAATAAGVSGGYNDFARAAAVITSQDRHGRRTLLPHADSVVETLAAGNRLGAATGASDHGVCEGCTCKPQPSQFNVVNGVSVLTRCPRRPATSVEYTNAWRPRDTVRHAPLRDRVLQAVRRAEDGITAEQISGVLGERAADVTAAADQLVREALLVRLLRMRPPSPAVRVYTMPDRTTLSSPPPRAA